MEYIQIIIKQINEEHHNKYCIDCPEVNQKAPLLLEYRKSPSHDEG